MCKTALNTLLSLICLSYLGCAAVTQPTVRLDTPRFGDGKYIVPDGDPAPSVGALKIGSKTGRAACSLVLIDESVALTAAHCARMAGFLPHYASFDRKSYEVAKIETHSRFTGGGLRTGGDIAVVFLETPVYDITPAELYDSEIDNDDAYRLIQVSGYGKDGVKRATVPGTWLLGALAGSDNIIWLAIESHLDPGDSGGGVFWGNTNTLIGINSAVYLDRSDENRVYASLATRVDLYIDWIEETIEEFENPEKEEKEPPTAAGLTAL